MLKESMKIKTMWVEPFRFTDPPIGNSQDLEVTMRTKMRTSIQL